MMYMTNTPSVRSLATGYGGLDLAVGRVFNASLYDWSDVDSGPVAAMRRHTETPNLGDLKAIDWASVDRTDILTAGYPCQPFSNAGKRLGTEDPRHLWPWIADGIRVVRPQLIVLENVASHLRRGFDVVLADLAEIGYDVAWSVVRASDVGAPHERARLYVVAADPSRELLDGSGDEWPGRRYEFADGRLAAAYAHGEGEPQPSGAQPSGRRWIGYGSQLATHPSGLGWRERWSGATGQLGGPDAPVGGSIAAVAAYRWGKYATAVARWEALLGVEAPEPVMENPRSKLGWSLSPLFVEWMMGLEPGHVTDTPGLSRTALLKLLGNGVVPQQAEFAIRDLYARIYTHRYVRVNPFAA